MCYDLQSFSDEDEENNDETEANNDILEIEPKQGNATDPENDEGYCDVTEVKTSMSPHHQNETVVNSVNRTLQKELGPL